MGPPEVNMEVDPPRVNMQVDPLEVNTEVDLPGSEHISGPPPEVNMEVDPPGSEHRSGPHRSGCRRGDGRGPTEKYCWQAGTGAFYRGI